MTASGDLGPLTVRLRADGSALVRGLDRAERQLRQVSQRMTHIGTRMSMALTAPIMLFSRKAVMAFAGFDDAMTKSLSIMGDVSGDMRKEMERTATTISKDSVKSAQELATSYFYLASAGMTAEQSVAALATVERFAVAGAFDMARATDLLTDAQSALGLSSKDAAENQRNMLYLSDALVKANTLANATVEQFSDALTNEAAAAMRAYNISVEEGVSVLAAYADQGIKGQVAGSMLGRMLRLTTSSINNNADAYKKLGISVIDARGNLLPLADIIEGIDTATRDMSVTQRAAALESIGFQARIQQAILPLLGAQDKIRGYEKELRKAGGTTKDVADKQMMSFSAQMTALGNRIQAVAMQIGDILAPVIQTLGGYLDGLILQFERLSPDEQKWVVWTGLIVAVTGPVLLLIGLLTKLGAVGLALSAGPILLIGAGLYAAYVAVDSLSGGLGDLWDRFSQGSSVIQTASAELNGWMGYLKTLSSELLERVQTTMGAIANAFRAGEILLSVQILWAHIEMETMRGLAAMLSVFGPFADGVVEIWDVMGYRIGIAIDWWEDRFRDALQGLLPVIRSLYITIMDSYNAWQRIAGNITDTQEMQQKTVTRHRARDMGFEHSPEEQLARRAGRQQSFLDTRAGRTPVAEIGAEALRAAEMRLESLGLQASVAADSVKAQANAAKIVAAEEAERAATMKEVSDTDGGIKEEEETVGARMVRGGFLANMLEGIGGAEAEEKIQEDQLEELRKIRRETERSNEREMDSMDDGSILLE